MQLDSGTNKLNHLKASLLRIVTVYGTILMIGVIFYIVSNYMNNKLQFNIIIQ